MSDFDARLTQLRLRFVAASADKAAALRQAAADEDRETLRTLVHKLSGSAGLFGHAEIGRRAAEVEAALDNMESWQDVAPRLDLLLKDLEAAGR